LISLAGTAALAESKGRAVAKNTICVWYDKDAEAAARFYAAEPLQERPHLAHFATVAGETRSLDRKHRTDTTVTDCGQQALEAWTGNAAARSSEIVVDDLDSRPAKLPGTISKHILSSLAFKIVHELIWR